MCKIDFCIFQIIKCIQPNTPTMCGFFDFCRNGNLEALKEYIAVYPIPPKHLPYCLQLATLRGHSHIIKFLIETLGATPNPAFEIYLK